jgi:alpha/beta superfamily hydrolase
MIYIAFLILTLLILLFVFYEGQFFMLFTPVFYRKDPLCELCSVVSAKMQDGTVLEGAVYEPQNPQTTLLVFVGRSHDAVGLINRLAECYSHVRVVTFNYRGYGKSQGRADEEKLLEDSLEIARLVAKNYGQFYILGFSIGSSMAAYVASKQETKALFLLGAFDSIHNLAQQRYRFLPSWLIRYKFETCQYVQQVQAPTYLFVSLADEVVTIESARKLKECIKNLLFYKEYKALLHKELLFDDSVVETVQKVLYENIGLISLDKEEYYRF